MGGVISNTFKGVENFGEGLGDFFTGKFKQADDQLSMSGANFADAVTFGKAGAANALQHYNDIRNPVWRQAQAYKSWQTFGGGVARTLPNRPRTAVGTTSNSYGTNGLNVVPPSNLLKIRDGQTRMAIASSRGMQRQSLKSLGDSINVGFANSVSRPSTSLQPQAAMQSSPQDSTLIAPDISTTLPSS